jgi:hypothetical protein
MLSFSLGSPATLCMHTFPFLALCNPSCMLSLSWRSVQPIVYMFSLNHQQKSGGPHCAEALIVLMPSLCSTVILLAVLITKSYLFVSIKDVSLSLQVYLDDEKLLVDRLQIAHDSLCLLRRFVWIVIPGTGTCRYDFPDDYESEFIKAGDCPTRPVQSCVWLALDLLGRW